jgi:hypothetical protein
MHGEAGVWVHERLPWLEVGFYGFCHSIGSMSRTKRETDSLALQQNHERGVTAGSMEVDRLPGQIQVKAQRMRW